MVKVWSTQLVTWVFKKCNLQETALSILVISYGDIREVTP